MIKNKAYTLTKEEIQQCKDFAELSWKSHLAKGRTPDQIKYHITLGKKGEIAFYNISKGHHDIYNISKPNFVNNKYGDGGSDFLIETLNANGNTDVKAIDAPYKRRVYISQKGNWQMISVIQMEGDTGTYIGTIPRIKLKIINDNINDTIYVNKEDFEKSLI